MKKIKIAIAGFGIVGKKRYECVIKNKNLELIAICDKKFKKKSFIKNNIQFFKSYKDMINCDIEAIIISMSNDIAPEVTIASLKKGIHVFCEKPPGRNLEDIINVRKEEKKHKNLKLMYGFNHRYHKSILRALKIIKSKKLGSIINIRGIYGKSKLLTFNQTSWRTNRKIAGGGILLDQGIHMLDLLRLFSGEFHDIKSFVSNSHWKYNVEDNAYAIMKSSRGIYAMLHSSGTQWKHLFRLEINLTRGSLILSGILSASKSYGSEKLNIYNENNKKDNKIKNQVIRYYKDNSWTDELKDFVKFINKNSKVTSSSSYDALQSMKLVYEIYCSDRIWKNKYKINIPKVSYNEK